MQEETVKVSLKLPVLLVEKTKDFARRHVWPFSDVVRLGLADTMYLKECWDRGGNIKLVKADGTVSELVWKE